VGFLASLQTYSSEFPAVPAETLGLRIVPAHGNPAASCTVFRGCIESVLPFGEWQLTAARSFSFSLFREIAPRTPPTQFPAASRIFFPR